jgi:hypothetical protein
MDQAIAKQLFERFLATKLVDIQATKIRETLR